jgi:hypothetical protein
MGNFESCDLSLADAQPVLGRAAGVPPETVCGFIVVVFIDGGAVALSCSDNISPDQAAGHLTDVTERLVVDLIIRREGLN